MIVDSWSWQVTGTADGLELADRLGRTPRRRVRRRVMGATNPGDLRDPEAPTETDPAEEAPARTGTPYQSFVDERVRQKTEMQQFVRAEREAQRKRHIARERAQRTEEQSRQAEEQSRQLAGYLKAIAPTSREEWRAYFASHPVQLPSNYSFDAGEATQIVEKFAAEKELRPPRRTASRQPPKRLDKSAQDSETA